VEIGSSIKVEPSSFFKKEKMLINNNLDLSKSVTELQTSLKYLNKIIDSQKDKFKGTNLNEMIMIKNKKHRDQVRTCELK